MWKPIDTPPGPPFLCSSSRSSLRLWPTVNRNNGERLLGGQGAAGAANEAADESAGARSVNPPADGTHSRAGKYSQIQPRGRKNLVSSCSRPLGGPLGEHWRTTRGTTGGPLGGPLGDHSGDHYGGGTRGPLGGAAFTPLAHHFLFLFFFL